MTTNPGSPLRPELWRLLRREFRLDWQGIHGVPHWGRVLVHGRYLAAQTGAALRVVELFAVLHDVKRKHDGQDPEHGLRAPSAVPAGATARLPIRCAGRRIRWRSARTAGASSGAERSAAMAGRG